MTPVHLMNIVTHIGAGAVAILIGFYLMWNAKGTPQHRKIGRVFAYFTLLVCVTGAIGNMFFRFIPLFAVLTVLVLYQLLSGWHVIYTRERGPDWVDAALTASAIVWLAILSPRLVQSMSTQGGSATVIYSSLGAVATLIFYDTMRWLFPQRWHGSTWRYEHIYKIVASLFAMLSAASGNLIRFGQPWSQLAPSVIGIVCIAWLMASNYRKQPAEPAFSAMPTQPLQ